MAKSEEQDKATSKNKFKWPKNQDEAKMMLSPRQLNLLDNF